MQAIKADFFEEGRCIKLSMLKIIIVIYFISSIEVFMNYCLLNLIELYQIIGIHILKTQEFAFSKAK